MISQSEQLELMPFLMWICLTETQRAVDGLFGEPVFPH